MGVVAVMIKNRKIFIVLIGMVLVVMFRGLFKYGMEYDEVYRINNWFPFFNEKAYPYDQSICSIQLGSIKIPLMLKSYISYFCIVPYMMISWFEHPFFILRGLYYIYTLMGIGVLYVFISKYNERIAQITAVLLTINPFMYPEVRFGWANLMYGVGLAIAAEFWIRYNNTKKLRYLWLCVLILCLQINIQFYYIWVAAAVIMSLFIIYPGKFIDTIFHVKNMLAVLSAVLLGMINYVIYNVKEGFPTLMILWNYLFNLDEYNKNAIDNKKTENLFSAFELKWNSYLTCVGIWKEIFVLFVIILFMINIILAVMFIYKKQLDTEKVYFMPALITLFAFFMMLISPNSQGAHHLTYIIIPFVIWIASTCEMLFRNISNKFARSLIYGSIFAIGVVFFIQSNVSVEKANETEGTGYFSSNIFELISYVDAHNEITDKNMFFIQWGYASQFYFMHKGEFQVKELFWGAYNPQAIHDKTVAYALETQENTVYVPIKYIETDNAAREEMILLLDSQNKERYVKADKVVCQWIDEFIGSGAECSIESAFEEKDGNNGIMLIKIDNFRSAYKK